MNIFGFKKQYSYIKKPFARNGWIAAVLAVFSCGLTQGILFVSVQNNGDVGFLSALLAVFAILFDISGVMFGIAGMLEKDKNYIIVIASFIVEIAILLEWVLIVR